MNYYFYINEQDLNENERKHNRVSYANVIKRYVGDMVLCNELPNVDPTVWDNLNIGACDDDDYIEIYQWYICHLDDDEIRALTHFGAIVTRSDLLDCDVIAVDHYGTSWDYVDTDAIPTQDYSKAFKPWVE